MKVAFVYGDRFNSRLTKLFTGTTCYHVGFTDGRHFWDMNLLRRRRVWPLYPAECVRLVGAPATVTREYLESRLETDDRRYGWLDYLLFGLRWAYHLVGKSTRNMGGIICSEMVAEDLVENGWDGWDPEFEEVPSPGDLEAQLLGCRDAIKGCKHVQETADGTSVPAGSFPPAD